MRVYPLFISFSVFLMTSVCEAAPGEIPVGGYLRNVVKKVSEELKSISQATFSFFQVYFWNQLSIFSLSNNMFEFKR